MASLPTAVRSTAPKIAKSALHLQRRAISDVHITRTGKPLIRTTGGRFVAPLPASGILLMKPSPAPPSASTPRLSLAPPASSAATSSTA
jgi:hypothetical protein